MASKAAFAVCCGLALVASAADPGELEARSVVSLGNTARLERVMARARRGEKIVVGVIGGSITAGAGASATEKRWADLVAGWWRERFPQAQVEYVNAGIGATGSDIGAHRAAVHLINKRPDFVVIEYAVNDSGSPIIRETVEGLVRQILTQPDDAAAMMLFTMNSAGQNVQAEHAVVGEHYGLPMVSFRDALWPEVEAKRIAWEDIEADEVHPSDRGHQYCAGFITHVLDEVLAGLPEDDALPPIPALPTPKYTDLYQHAAFYSADTLRPVRHTGWAVITEDPYVSFFGPAWRAETPGSELEFEVEGAAIGVIFYRVKGATGIAEASIDGSTPVSMDGWFNQDWGGYTPFITVASGLTAGKHTLRIRLTDRKAEESTGHEFIVYAITAAGKKG